MLSNARRNTALPAVSRAMIKRLQDRHAGRNQCAQASAPYGRPTDFSTIFPRTGFLSRILSKCTRPILFLRMIFNNNQKAIGIAGIKYK